MLLKRIRVTLAVVFFALTTFLFLDFSNLLPAPFNVLAEIQFIPALLSGSFVVLIALLLLTLLLGRVYCSVVCPLGIYQDIAAWFSKRLTKRKKYNYSKGKKMLRYGTLIVTFIAFFAGATILLSLLDPYSAYGRMVTNLFKPAYMAGNNILAGILNGMGNFSLYNVDIYLLSLSSLIVGILTFLVIGILAWRYGRTYCNTLCPVGTILGFLSQFSFLKIRIDEKSCNHCGQCATKCKASCIDSKNNQIDYSRCVSCYDCIQVCKQKSIRYSFVQKKKQTATATTPDSSKRMFLTVLGSTALIAPAKIYAKGFSKLKTNRAITKKHPLSPPGSKSAEHLLHHCTACHLCVAKCPSHVLKPAFTEYGLGGMMQPRMDFTKGFCNYTCTICSNTCPNGAIEKLTQEEKVVVQMGQAQFVKTNCIVYTDQTSCGACSEHCPTQAVHMIPYLDGLTIPSVNTAICVGCGGCEYICPAAPYKAIYVEGNPVHLRAKAISETKQEAIKVDDFGF